MKRFLALTALIALLAIPAAMACEKHAAMKASAEQGCPSSMKGVERTVTNTDNGVKMQLTSADPAVVSHLQKMMASGHEEGCCKDCPLSNAAWTRKAENIENGVVVTLTAASPDEVGKLQTSLASMAKGGCGHEAAADKGGCPKKAAAKADTA